MLKITNQEKSGAFLLVKQRGLCYSTSIESLYIWLTAVGRVSGNMP